MGIIQSIYELTYSKLMTKQKSISKLFPTFYQRVQKVANNGGVQMDDMTADTWKFNIASGTTKGKKYDAYVNWKTLPKLIQKHGTNRRIWNKDKTAIDLRKLAAKILYDADLQLFCSCLTGDTKVRLLDGRVLPISEIHEEFGSNNEFWVIASDEHGDPVPAKAISLGITNVVTELVEVTLDNGQTVKCTSDHLFRLRNGEYKMAGLLQEGDSLMPLYIKETQKKCADGYNHSVVRVERIVCKQPTPVYDLSVEQYQNFALDAGIFVHNCPADLYWGGAYIRTQKGAKYTEPENRPPDIRNPNQRGAFCKHLQLLMGVLPMYTATLANYIKMFYLDDVSKVEKGQGITTKQKTQDTQRSREVQPKKRDDLKKEKDYQDVKVSKAKKAREQTPKVDKAEAEKTKKAEKEEQDKLAKEKAKSQEEVSKIDQDLDGDFKDKEAELKKKEKPEDEQKGEETKESKMVTNLMGSFFGR